MSAEQADKVIGRVEDLLGVFTEQLNSQFTLVLEAVDVSTKDIPRMVQQLDRVVSDTEAIKSAVTATNKDLQLLGSRTDTIEAQLGTVKEVVINIDLLLENHEKRITKLEAASA